MASTLVGLCLLDPTEPVFAQDRAAHVVFPTGLKVGTRILLLETRSDEQSGEGVEPHDVSVSSPVTCEVRARNDSGFVLAWSSEWKRKRAEPERLELLIQTDEMGSPVRVINADEIREVARRYADQRAEEGDSGPSREETDQVIDSEFLMYRVMEDVTLYFMFAGGEFDVGTRYSYKQDLPNSILGTSIPARVEYWVASVDAVAHEALVHYEQKVDAEALREYITSLVPDPSSNDESLQELASTQMDLTSTAVYRIDMTTGLPNHVLFERITRMGPSRSRQAIEIERRSFRGND